MNNELFSQLKQQLSRSWLKRDSTSFNSSSVALTNDGKYFSGLMESRTHLLDITSEHAALAQAVSCKDAQVTEVITVVDGEFMLNPLVVKVLADHVRRTGIPVSYRVFDTSAKQLYHCDNIMNLYYTPSILVLDKIKPWQKSSNWTSLDSSRDIKDQLRECALLGMQTHFSSNTKTSYGAAVVAGDRIYFGGVYSSFDHRMNLHSEMVAALSAINDGHRDISWIGIISNKFVTDLPHMCGCCRQFFSEIQSKTGTLITVTAFSFDGSQTLDISLNEYLPAQWSSGLELEERK